MSKFSRIAISMFVAATYLGIALYMTGYRGQDWLFFVLIISALVVCEATEFGLRKLEKPAYRDGDRP